MCVCRCNPQCVCVCVCVDSYFLVVIIFGLFACCNVTCVYLCVGVNLRVDRCAL